VRTLSRPFVLAVALFLGLAAVPASAAKRNDVRSWAVGVSQERQAKAL